jgi:DNA-binding MarR family transcriptional regulator
MATNTHFDPEAFAEIIRDSGCLTLREVARSLTRLYDQALVPTGLRATELGILRVCATLGPITLAELATGLDATLAMVQGDVKPLLAKGMLVKQAKASGGTVLVLTPQGKQSLFSAIRRWDQVQAWLIEHLGESRWRRIEQQLRVFSEIAE